MAIQTITSPTTWASEAAKMNSNFTELYTNVTMLLGGASGINIKYPPTGYSACIGDGVTDDSAAFTTLLGLAATRKCPLLVPYGTFLINGGNQLVRAVRIVGLAGYDSCLKMKSGQNVDFFVLANATDNVNAGAGMIGLRLDGNKANNTATGWSVLKVGGVSEDTIFENMHLENGYHGLSVDGGSYQWQYRFRNFLIEQMSGYGVNGLGTDNSFSNFVVGPTALDCVRAAGANCRVDNFKIYGSTTASGFYCAGTRLQFNNIDSQESFMHGFHIETGYDIVITNLNCDNNGFNWAEYTFPVQPPIKATPDSYGLYIEAGLDITVLGYNFSNRNASYKYGIGAYWVGTGDYSSQRIKIQLNHETNPYGTSIDNSVDGIDLFISRKKYYSITTDTTLTADHIGALIEVNSANPVVITVPTVATAPSIKNGRPVDTVFMRYGAGTVRIVAAAGNFINSVSGNSYISGQYGCAILRRRPSANDRWHLAGDLASS